MRLRNEYKELGIKRLGGHSSLAYQRGDGDSAEDKESIDYRDEYPRISSRDERTRYVAYLFNDNTFKVEPLTGRIKTGSHIKKASICGSVKRGERLIREWIVASA